MLNGHMDTVPVGNVESWKFDPFGEIKGPCRNPPRTDIT